MVKYHKTKVRGKYLKEVVAPKYAATMIFVCLSHVTWLSITFTLFTLLCITELTVLLCVQFVIFFSTAACEQFWNFAIERDFIGNKSLLRDFLTMPVVQITGQKTEHFLDTESSIIEKFFYCLSIGGQRALQFTPLAARVSDKKRIRGVVCEMRYTDWHLYLLCTMWATTALHLQYIEEFHSGWGVVMLWIHCYIANSYYIHQLRLAQVTSVKHGD